MKTLAGNEIPSHHMKLLVAVKVKVNVLGRTMHTVNKYTLLVHRRPCLSGAIKGPTIKYPGWNGIFLK